MTEEPTKGKTSAQAANTGIHLSSPEGNTDNNPDAVQEQVSVPWYALRLFTNRQEEVATALKGKGLEIFVPMEYADIEDRNHHRKHVLRPVVRNLLFIKKTKEEKDIRSLLSDIPYKMSVIRKDATSMEYYEIPGRQMLEFQTMCNPDLLMKKYLSEEQAKLKVGTPVLVTHGPLKGLKGKLVRSNKKYYLLKEVPGMGVMLKVTRWCCKALEF